MSELIEKEIIESIEVKKKLIATQVSNIEKCSNLLVQAFQNQKTVFLCGNGGSACDASHITAEFVVRFKNSNERRALSALCLNSDFSILTACSNDYGYERVFERQLEALAKKNDILIVFSTSGHSKNILLAIQKAKEIQIPVITFLGGDGGKMKNFI